MSKNTAMTIDQDVSGDVSAQQTVISPCEISQSFFLTTGPVKDAENGRQEQSVGRIVSSDGEWTKYDVMQEIGRGGMGRVILWKDKNINRVVATKVILRERQSSHQTIQRFLEEGQITGQLEHPNIVPIYEMGVDGTENFYFTMKYMKGETLKTLLDKLKKDPALCESWSLRRRLDIFQSVCHAMDYAHSKKVLHRDLKPENIMLGNFGEVMVMDWGLAKVMGQGQEVLSEDSVATLRSEGGFKTITGQIAGTPRYMSPEQAAGEIEKMDHLSDVYSLGVILYELTTGIQCVEGETLLNVLAKVSQGKIQEVPARGPFGPVPRELRCIIKKALQFKKENRYRSARDLAEDVQRFLDGKEVKACRYTLWDKTKKSVYRFRKELTLVAATILIILPAFLLWHRFQSQKQLQEQAARLVNEGENALAGEDYRDALKILEELSLAEGKTEKIQENETDFKTEAMPDKKSKEEEFLWGPPVARTAQAEERSNLPQDPKEIRISTAFEIFSGVRSGEITIPALKRRAASKSAIMAADKKCDEPSDKGGTTGPQHLPAPAPMNLSDGPERQEPMREKAQEPVTEKAQDTQKLRAQNFTRVKELLLANMEKSRKAFQLTQKYEFKRNEAELWLAMYKAATDAGEAGWQEIARYQIKTLVTEEDYENIYSSKLK